MRAEEVGSRGRDPLTITACCIITTLPPICTNVASSITPPQTRNAQSPSLGARHEEKVARTAICLVGLSTALVAYVGVVLA